MRNSPVAALDWIEKLTSKGPMAPLAPKPVGAPILYYTEDFTDAWWCQLVADQVNGYNQVVVCFLSDCNLKDGSEIAEKIVARIERKFKCELKEERRVSNAGDEDKMRIFYSTTKDVAIDLKFWDESFYAWVWAHDKKLAKKIVKQISKEVPKKYVDIDAGEIPIAFWRTSSHGARYDFRDLNCPKFKDIKDNYAPQVVKQIEELWSDSEPDKFGKIIIWHGPAGTGKTFAIRALAQEWFSRFGATIEIVMDPEVMFESAKYLYSMVISDPENDYMVERIAKRIREAQNKKFGIKDTDAPLRLIIIEDYAKLFTTEGRDHDGFARFLNLGDGLIGQGLRLVFLLTANEKIEYFDEAVVRPGRCIQTVEFPEFSFEDAVDWLVKKGMKAGAAKAAAKERKGKLTLANLYTILHGKEEPHAEDDKPFGFAH